MALVAPMGMDTLSQTLDCYIVHYKGTTRPVRFTTREGAVTYYADVKHPFDGRTLTIYHIESAVKRVGTLTRFLKYVTETPSLASVEIIAIESRILDEFLDRVEHLGGKWAVRGCDRVWVRPPVQ